MTKKKEDLVDRVFIKDGEKLLLNKQFVYEVDIYKLTPKSSNLEDSRHLASNTYTKNKSEYFTKDGISFRRQFSLVAAPEHWLNQNKFTESCPEALKQQKK